MARAWLGLGSNVGRRESNLRRALTMLAEHLHLEEVSSLYETEPVGYSAQGWFLNAVCVGTTTLDPVPLLQFAKEVEGRLGRVKTVRWGPRVLDIDILLYDNLVLEQDEALQIPHPRLAERAFVLAPLAELAPTIMHPVLGLSMAELRRRLASKGEVRLWKQRTGSIERPWATFKASPTTST